MNEARLFIGELRRRGGCGPSATTSCMVRWPGNFHLWCTGCFVSATADVIERLDALVNTPEIHDFAKAVVLEAAHQLERWKDTDPRKADADWFWLIGYLAGKALHNPLDVDEDARDKRLHRIITVAAAAANWHRAVSSEGQ